MTILALDTTSEYGSVAVRSNGETIAEAALHSPDGFAHVIFSSIEEVLGRAGIGVMKVDCFAATSGPGSFTGIRVGLSAVKGLAEAAGKSALGISNLRVLSSFGKSERRAVVLDARRGEVYAAVYGANLSPIAAEIVLPFASWLETLQEPEYEFISTAGTPFWLALQGTRFADMPFTEAPRSLAAAVALCAETCDWLDPAALDANYVRRSDAELFWRDA